MLSGSVCFIWFKSFKLHRNPIQYELFSASSVQMRKQRLRVAEKLA